MKLVTFSAEDIGQRATILSLQQLRFSAAGLVVLSHIEDRMVQFGERFNVRSGQSASAGVLVSIYSL